MSPYNAHEQARLAKLRAFDAGFALAVKWAVFLLLLLAVYSLLTGCASAPVRTASSVITSGNVYRLQNRPDADAAVKAAPEWCRDALHTIIDLEAELKEAKVRPAN